VLVLIVGIAALAFAVVMLLFGRYLGRSTRQTTHQPTRCAALREDSGRVLLTGIVEPGPHGMLSAPVSGRPCVWHSSTMIERWSELDRSLVRDFDRDGYLDRSEAEAAQRTRNSTKTNVSTEPFSLRDTTGRVLIDPRGLRGRQLSRSVQSSSGPPYQGYFPDNTVPIERAGFALNRAAPRGRSQVERSETILVPGNRVYLSGKVIRLADGEAVIGAPLRISTRSFSDVQRHTAPIAQLMTWLLALTAGAIGTVSLIIATRRG